MRLNKEANALIESNKLSSAIGKKEFDRVLKETNKLNKKNNKEFNKIANRPLLKQRLAQLYCAGSYNTKQIASILLISETTCKKLLKNNDVLDMIIAYQSEEKEIIDARIKSLRMRATEVMSELLESNDEAIQLQVAKDMLDRTGFKDKDTKDININISYEQQLEELAKGVDYEVIMGGN